MELPPVYQRFGLHEGRLELMTGIRERRYWAKGQTMADGATRAGRKALDASGVSSEAIGMLVYGGVCRDNLEPATACAVADGLKVGGGTHIFDVSNACLGILNGIVHVANAIELGHVRAGLVVSCESARQIVDLSIERMLAARDMEDFRLSLATLTGGSGAIGVVVADESLAPLSAATPIWLGYSVHRGARPQTTGELRKPISSAVWPLPLALDGTPLCVSTPSSSPVASRRSVKFA